MRKAIKYRVKERMDGLHYPQERKYVWGMPTPFWKYFRWDVDYSLETFKLIFGKNNRVCCHVQKQAEEFLRKASNGNL